MSVSRRIVRPSAVGGATALVALSVAYLRDMRRAYDKGGHLLLVVEQAAIRDAVQRHILEQEAPGSSAR